MSPLTDIWKNAHSELSNTLKTDGNVYNLPFVYRACIKTSSELADQLRAKIAGGGQSTWNKILHAM
jgi:hypothetical protein